MEHDRQPTCRACPKCGNTAAKTVRSSRLFTFSGDRRCTRCATHYTPPTPRWVAYLFLLIGGLLIVKPGIGVIAMVVAERNPDGDPQGMSVGGWVCLGLVAVTGLFSIWQGVRVWREVQVEPPSYAPTTMDR